MQFQNEGIQFTLGTQPVTIVVRATSGPFLGTAINLTTTQDALTARTPGGVEAWSDAEVLAEATALLIARGMSNDVSVLPHPGLPL